jgi:hypothetical protein
VSEHKHPNLGKFVVEKLSYAKPDEMVYMCQESLKGSNGTVLRYWSFDIKDAQVYKLRARAEQAAERWGGKVRQLA